VSLAALQERPRLKPLRKAFPRRGGLDDWSKPVEARTWDDGVRLVGECVRTLILAYDFDELLDQP